jgi:decaprenylphospho-beta-D-ribofuranose 2-oxidase
VSTSAVEAAAPAAVGGDGELVLLSGWGHTAPTRAEVRRPADAGAVGALIAAAGERGVLARGLGRAYGDAAQNAGGLVLLSQGLAGVAHLDAEAGLVTVGAGTSLGEVARATLPHGWFPAVVPGTRHVSVGGALAADVHGKNHHRDGAFGAHVASFDLVTPDGARRRVTRAGDPGAFAATVGGMGLTGVIVEATLRLQRVESDLVCVDTERAGDLEDMLDRLTRGDRRARHSVAWVDCLAQGRALGRGVVSFGNLATAAEAGPRRGRRRAAYALRPTPAVPAAVPPNLLSRPAVRAFNELYFHHAPRAEHGRLVALDAFHHPLDGVGDWSRLYGRPGLVQHQLVVPFGAEDVVRRVLERIAARRLPAFLAVLKRFGPGDGPLAFPAAGWTLAVDLPGRAELAAELDAWDEWTVAAGGRVYLAKDARMRPELLAAMYPRLDEWRAERARLDPDGRMRSDLARRLGL